MKKTSLIFIFILGVFFKTKATDLETIRKNYELAVNDKEICKHMINELINSTESNIHLAYLGAFQTIWANHIINPISKLNTFNKGKKNIEFAIKNAPKNVEIRFVRLSIQKNSPNFLGYNDYINEDNNFIKKNKNTITSTTLKKMIQLILNQ